MIVLYQIYRIMCNKGYAKLDFASVFQFLKVENNNNQHLHVLCNS